MGLNLNLIDGQTPLDEDEIDGLLIPSISNRGELDEFEQQNIEEAVQWSITRNIKPQTVLSESFVKEVHKRMFNQVWRWAGDFRRTNKNLGVDKWQIATELNKLLQDTIFWVENDTYPSDEIAVRFKHRIVSIHCFANGNGRHSRLMADIIVDKIYKKPVFNWGAGNLIKNGDVRTMYLKAIKAADNGDYAMLLNFARS
jgi:Fic-DOC domain mobile mystery protein B